MQWWSKLQDLNTAHKKCAQVRGFQLSCTGQSSERGFYKSLRPVPSGGLGGSVSEVLKVGSPSSSSISGELTGNADSQAHLRLLSQRPRTGAAICA